MQIKCNETVFSVLSYKLFFKRDKRTIIGYFTAKESPEFDNFAKVAKVLKDDCRFYAGFG